MGNKSVYPVLCIKIVDNFFIRKKTYKKNAFVTGLVSNAFRVE